MKAPEPLSPIILSNLRNATREVIPQHDRYSVPDELQIIELLQDGLDSYRITQRLGCSYRDVVNVARKHAGIRGYIADLDITDEQTTNPVRRMSLFPPINEDGEQS